MNNSGSLLGGTGMINAPITVNTGAAITANTRGTSGTVVAANVGLLSTGSGALTLTSGSIFHVDVLNTAGTSYDQVMAAALSPWEASRSKAASLRARPSATGGCSN